MSGLHEVVIGDHTFQFGAWNTSKGVSLMTWLAKKVGGPIAAFAAVGLSMKDATEQQKKEMDSAGDKMFTESVMTSLQELSESEMNTKLKEIVAGDDVLMDGKKVVYETSYARKYGLMFKVAMANLEYQYDDFLGELLGLVAMQQGVSQEKIKQGLKGQG